MGNKSSSQTEMQIKDLLSITDPTEIEEHLKKRISDHSINIKSIKELDFYVAKKSIADNPEGSLLFIGCCIDQLWSLSGKLHFQKVDSDQSLIYLSLITQFLPRISEGQNIKNLNNFLWNSSSPGLTLEMGLDDNGNFDKINYSQKEGFDISQINTKEINLSYGIKLADALSNFFFKTNFTHNLKSSDHEISTYSKNLIWHDMKKHNSPPQY